MEEKVNAIMIKSVDYGDNDKILTLFSLEEGVISAKIKGVKKAGAKLKFSAEPFCFCEYVLAGKGDRRTVINAYLHDSFYPIRMDIDKLYSAGAVCEFIKKFSPENVISEGLFHNAVECLKTLAYTESGALLPLVVFLVQGVKQIGYGLDASSCTNCGGKITRAFFDFSSGSFACENCKENKHIEISHATYEILSAVCEKGYGVIENKNDFSEEYLRRTLSLLKKYLKENAFEEIKNISSLLSI